MVSQGAEVSVRKFFGGFLAMVCFAGSACFSNQCLHAGQRSEAYAGEPFGVGRVTVDVFRGEPAIPLSDERFTLWEESGRAFYPVQKQEPAKRLVRQLLKIETPASITIYYLFLGEEPFDLATFSPVEHAVRVKPQSDPAGHRRLLDEWWQQATGRWQQLQKDPAFPPIAENFLVASLARRLNRPLPEPMTGLLSPKKAENTVWDELFVSESHRLAIDREMVFEPGLPGQVLQPIPEPPEWSDVADSETDVSEELAMEEIAAYVPEECFYLRFGTFTNYLWFRDLNKKWKGDLQNMIVRRGIRRGASERTQQQLALRESALAKILGPHVIADAAIIGFDPYTDLGAGVGILFHAKNDFLLSQDLMSKRREALEKFSDATETTVQIADRDISLISTSDGRVRSYYLQLDSFHLVTNSAKLIERFIEAGQGTGSLASLASFHRARAELPISRNDSVFAFISEKFLQNLCSPHYRIESRRRVRSARETRLIELAQYAAATEGVAAQSVEELVAAGILPSGFAVRADSSVLEQSESVVVDSQRGALGFFRPIADVPEFPVSAEEAAAYERFAKKFRDDVGQMPPIAAGIQRLPNEAGGETMSLDLLVEPLDKLKLGSLRNSLGEPSEQRLQPVAGDVVSFEAVLDVPVPLMGGESQPHHLFGGLRDFLSPLVVEKGKLALGDEHTELIRGYLGAWPRPGLLQLLTGNTPPNGEEAEPVGEDFWQAQKEKFLLISFKPEVVEEVLPQLALQPVEKPGQVWLHVEDLTGKKLAAMASTLGYMRARETSVAASRLMNNLANLLHVPRHECRALAERLVDGTFVCPLGGEYELFAPERSLEVWCSSALAPSNQFLLTEVPDDYQLPLLTWFRGLRGELGVVDDSLSVHLEVDLSAAAVP